MASDAEATRREHAIAIYRDAVAAADPYRLVKGVLSRQGNSIEIQRLGERRRWEFPLLIVGAGKGAARMALACEEILEPRSLSGCVVVNDGAVQALDCVEVLESGHPIPDERGIAAAQRIFDLISKSTAPTLLVLISGGASSLLVAPRPPVTLADKMATTRLLLRCGADISEINSVRKHLSEVKGGGLLRRARRPTLTLLVSDVVGDDASTVGSGPSVADHTTFADAWSVLMRHELTERVPRSVRQLLQRGTCGLEPETVKPGSHEAGDEAHYVVGSNQVALDAAARAARERGWQVEFMSRTLTGSTTDAADEFVTALRGLTGRRGLCLLAGGETTVEVKGAGRGGRNQEFALHLAEALDGLDASILSAGTDGVDGPTDAAGAFVDGSTLARASDRGLNPTCFLASNDSYGFFDAMGDLWRCGPTGTNVMDIKIALIGRPLSGGCA